MKSSDLDLSNVDFLDGFEYMKSSFVTSPYDDNSVQGYTKVSFDGDNNFESSSGMDIYLPEYVDETTNVVIVFPGGWNEASSPSGKVNFDKTLLWKQPNFDDNTIYIRPSDAGMHFKYQNAVCASIDQLTGVIPANWNNVTIAGVSVGGGKAWNAALASVKGDYNFKVSTLAIGDSYHIERSSYDTPSTDEDYALFVENGVRLVAVTNDDANPDRCNKDCVRMVRKYMAAGGDTLYIEYDSGHDQKCIDPYEKNLLAWMNGTGELDESFVADERVKFWISEKDELTGEVILDKDGLPKIKELSYDEFTEVKNDLLNYSEVVSMDYEFVNLNIEKLRNLVDRCNILSLDKVTIDTGGLLTLSKASEYFNDYVTTSQSFLTELTNTYGFILGIADSMHALDSSLAEQINLNSHMKSLSSFQEIMSVNLTPIEEFYKDFSMIDLSMIPASNDVKITSQMLIELLSDRNIMRASLIEDIRDTTRIRDSLERFITDSKDVLTGPALDLMRAKLMEYSSVCDSKIAYAENLKDTMYNSFMELLDYMEDYDMLDTSMIPEVKSQMSSVRTRISNLEQELASLQHMHGQPIYGEDEDGNPIIIGHIDNSAQIASVSAEIANLEIVLNELIQLKNKLDGLKPKDQSVADKMSDADSASLDSNFSSEGASSASNNQGENTSGYSVEDGVRDCLSGRAGNGTEVGEPRYRYLQQKGLSDQQIREVQARLNQD